ncbi:MAG: hypothetical protein ACTSUE_16240 [Promethearchaeota archaeon]
MDYLGFSIYSRHLMGDRAMLESYGIQGDEPEDVFPQLLEDIKQIVMPFKEGNDVGGVIHFCNLAGLMRNSFISEPWNEALATANLTFPFVTGVHINFSHDNLPLTPGFIPTFVKTMELCRDLNVDSMVLHAPLVETSNTNVDWSDFMMQEEILEAMRLNDTILCWENAQDSTARYRLLKNLLGWRNLMTRKLESSGNEDLINRYQFCFDTGHFILSMQRDGAPQDEVDTYLPEFGKNVKVFHIQANDGRSDQHLIPFISKNHVPGVKINWEQFNENSKVVLKNIRTCDENSTLDGRHLHLEVDAPSPISEMVNFYKKYYHG